MRITCALALGLVCAACASAPAAPAPEYAALPPLSRPQQAAAAKAAEQSSSTSARVSADARGAGCPRAMQLEATAVRAEVACLLARYVQLDTTNPPGNELIAARFVADVLAREGIEAQILESAPGRANLVARLPGDGRGKALVLMHHMDVVPANAEGWSVPPLSAEVADGVLWGRGSLDDKGPGVAMLSALLLVKRLGTPLGRDLIFVAVADEEAGGGLGARWLMEQHFELFDGAELALNEGGGILELEPGKPSYLVEVAQKAPLWLKLTATGPAGHGSSPSPQAATHVLARALARLQGYTFDAKVVPAVAAIYAARARDPENPDRKAHADLAAALEQRAFATRFLSNPQQATQVRNSLAITMLGASDKENVIAEHASAVLDLRLLPGEDPAAVIETLRKVMAEPAIEIETLLSWTAHESARDTPLFAAIEALAQAHDPGAAVSANMISGFTDCNALRARGITCYGFLPMRIAMEDIHRIHGNDERVSLDALSEAALRLHELIAKIASP